MPRGLEFGLEKPWPIRSDQNFRTRYHESKVHVIFDVAQIISLKRCFNFYS